MPVIGLAFRTAFRDLGKHRARAVLGIFGITISIGLLAGISLLTDSVSLGFVDFITTDSGSRDVDITVNYLPEQPDRSSYFEYKAMMQDIQAQYTEFNKFIPRIETNAYTTRVENKEVVWYSVPIIAMNLTLEEQVGFGSFLNESYNYSLGIPENYCIITPTFREFFHVNVGQNFTMTRSDVSKNFTVLIVSESLLKFKGEATGGNMEELGVSMSFETFASWQGSWYEGKVNHLLLTFTTPSNYYDVRDLQGSVTRVLAISEDLQEFVGYGYKLDLPKLSLLQYAEFMAAAMTIVFVFIAIIAMLISGILINGILSTSVEERIRDFGIFRTLGARKNFNIKLILYQGLFLCLGGTSIGFGLAMGGVKFLVIPFAEYLARDYLSSPVPFVVSPLSVFSSYSIGIIVSLAVSLAPALKVARLQIVQAINPYRHEETLYKIMKESKVNYKLITVGAILAINGGFIFFAIPTLLFSMNISLMVGVLVFVLLLFLIGLTFVGLGLMPLLQRFFVNVFGLFFKKVIHIIRITVFRYQRRNNTSVLMFSVSFAFIMFTTSIVADIQQNVATMERFNAGSEIVVYSHPNWGTVPTLDFQYDLMKIPGIEKTSVVLAQPPTLTNIYSDTNKRFSAEVADYINYQSMECTIYPVDEYYPDTIFTEYIEFSEGSMATSFPELFVTGEQNCILSQAVAATLAVKVGDKIRLTFTRGEESTPVAFTIVGIAGKMPGCSRFKSSAMMGSSQGGVMISHAQYKLYMGLPSPTWVEKIFIKVQDNENITALTTTIQQNIIETYSTIYGIDVSNVESEIAEASTTYDMIALVFELMLIFTIVICLFGLLSATYSTILERRREIAVIRTLGLRSVGVTTLFSLESLITFLSSASAGTIIGYFTAYLLSGVMNLFTESPQVMGFPLATFLRTFGISIIFLLAGLWILLRKVRKQKIIEIYRETL